MLLSLVLVASIYQTEFKVNEFNSKNCRIDGNKPLLLGFCSGRVLPSVAVLFGSSFFCKHKICFGSDSFLIFFLF